MLTKTGKLSKMADECHYKSGSGVRLSESEHELLTYKMGKVNQDISS